MNENEEKKFLAYFFQDYTINSPFWHSAYQEYPQLTNFSPFYFFSFICYVSSWQYPWIFRECKELKRKENNFYFFFFFLSPCLRGEKCQNMKKFLFNRKKSFCVNIKLILKREREMKKPSTKCKGEVNVCKRDQTLETIGD